MDIDGQDRRAAAWPDWQITTRIDASDHWRTVWKAVHCHQTQIPASHHVAHLTESSTRYCGASQPIIALSAWSMADEALKTMYLQGCGYRSEKELA